MGSGSSSQQAPDAHLQSLETHPVDLPGGAKSRIAIVGGGPAGIHMASCLKRLGFENVVVLEKQSKSECRFGKTHDLFLEETNFVEHTDVSDEDATVKKTPHQMGTCYLSWSYKHVRNLLKEYVGPAATIQPGGGPKGPYGKLHLPSPHLDAAVGKQTTTSDEWLYANREAITIESEFLRKILPDKMQSVGFVLDVAKYRRLHESLLGRYDYHGLPPRPSQEAMSTLDTTFGELLVKNGLKTLLELCCIGFGSYGLGYDVPALYGLWFVTPEAVESYIAAKFNSNVKTVEVVQNGYSSLWQSMISKDKLNVKYDVDIKRIERSLEDYTKPIRITTEIAGGAEDVIECDLLVFAAPMHTAFLPIVSDATQFEKDVVQHLTSVGLVVSLFKTAKKAGIRNDKAEELEEAALTFYPESLMPELTPKPSGEVYAERNSVRSGQWQFEPKSQSRYTVAYQYFPNPMNDTGIKDVTAKALDFITNPEFVITPTPKVPVEPALIFQKNWDYFPHFTSAGVQAGLPWKVFEQQGRNRTWYIGSSVSFESVEDVTKYNLQLLASQKMGRFKQATSEDQENTITAEDMR